MIVNYQTTQNGHFGGKITIAKKQFKELDERANPKVSFRF